MMKTTKYMLLCAAVMTMLLAACDIETSGNGDLDGYWSLRQVDSVATDTQTDVSEQRIFWSVQHNLLQTDDLSHRYTSCLFRFQHTGNTLTLSSPFFYGRENGDEPVDDIEALRPFGINAIPETFTVERLKGNDMTLSSSTVTLHFKRY